MKKRIALLTVILAIALTGCNESSSHADTAGVSESSSYIQTSESNTAVTSVSTAGVTESVSERIYRETTRVTRTTTPPKASEWSGTDYDTFKAKYAVVENNEWKQSVGAYATVNGNEPFFSKTEKSITECFERYSELDSLGRCGTAYANVGKAIMPETKRESIGSVRPSGWQTSKYDKSVIPDMYLYNRCHLIAFMLAGENANPKNLITGTRYLNIEGMLPFEDKVHDYIEKNPNNHVLYRVTPLYKGKDLVARGVLMEGYSVEDKGQLRFCVFCYNNQPMIKIDYSNGNNALENQSVTSNTPAVATQKAETAGTTQSVKKQSKTWIVNNKTMKYHYPDCSAVKKIKEGNKGSITASCEEMNRKGYSPCGICKPN